MDGWMDAVGWGLYTTEGFRRVSYFCTIHYSCLSQRSCLLSPCCFLSSPASFLCKRNCNCNTQHPTPPSFSPTENSLVHSYPAPTLTYQYNCILIHLIPNKFTPRHIVNPCTYIHTYLQSLTNLPSSSISSTPYKQPQPRTRTQSTRTDEHLIRLYTQA